MIYLPIHILGIFLLLTFHLINGWEIKVGYSDSHVTIGKFYTLRCSVIGIDEPPNDISISFHKEGLDKPITITRTPKKVKNAEEYYSVLMLTKIKEEDTGIYECIVNIDGEIKSSEKVQLNVVDPPEFINPKPNQTPEEGSTAHIECFVKNHDNYDIYWTFNGTIIQEGTPRNYDFLEGSQILVIPKFNSTIDNGLYECVAAYHNTIEKMSIDVIGYARPSMTVFEPFNSTEVPEGSNFAIQCQAVGKPKPTYEWRVTKNGIETTIEKTDKYKVEGGLLSIDTIDTEDTGNYTCYASNIMGMTQSSVFVKVVRMPEIKKILPIEVMKDDDVVLECHYKSDGTTSVGWYYNGEITTLEELNNLIDSSEMESESISDEESENSLEKKIENGERFTITETPGLLKLTINNILKEDVGMYRCTVDNAAGKKSMKTLVNIKYAPIPIPPREREIITMNYHNSTVECEFEGKPIPHIEWYHNGSAITSTNSFENSITKTGIKSTLYISGDVSSYDMFGEYHCLGSNSVKQSVPSESVILYLKEKPEVPTISCSDELSPTKAICNVDPGIEPGRRPETIKIVYYIDDLELDDEEDVAEDQKHLQQMNYDETIIIKNLTPDTNYVGRGISINGVGSSDLGPKFYFKTDPPGLPEPIKSININCNQICTITWEHAETNGGGDLKYKLTLNATQNLEKNSYDLMDLQLTTIETSNNQLTFEHLKPETQYTINVITITKEGESEVFSEVFETPDTLVSQSLINWPFGSFSKFLTISSISMILILITIDFILYITYRCGFIFFILTHCCGKKLKKTSQNNEDIENNGPESSKLLSENQPINVRQKKREIYGPITTYV